MNLNAWRDALNALPEGVTEAEINAETTDNIMIWVSGGRITGSKSFRVTKHYVRATAGKTGMVYTEDLTEPPEQVILRAAANARYSTADAPEPLRSGPGEKIRRPFSMPTPAEMLAVTAAAEKSLLAGGAVIDYLCCVAGKREMTVLNSRGLDAESESGYIRLECMISFPREGMQDACIETNLSAECLEKLDPDLFAAKALRLCGRFDMNGVKPASPSSGTYDAVISGQVMRNILMTAWRSLSAESMQTGISCFHSAGEVVGSPAFSVINAPAHPLCGEYYPIDSEGSPVTSTGVVRNGVLECPLYTLRSAAKAGVGGSGCAGRVPCMTGNVPIDLTTVPSVLYLCPGTQTEDQLLARMGTGLYLTYSLDLFHSVNISSGEFSVPCGGVWFENGRPAYSVSQMTVAGTLKELFSSVEAVGNDLDFDLFYFRNYLIGSPAVLSRGLKYAL